MKIIAHRGLIDGPNKDIENNPFQIQRTLNLGYDCEIDLWVQDSKFYLGHDYPQYQVTEDFLRNDKFWIHAKNINALYWLSNQANEINYFWHDVDRYIITSKHFIWTCDQENLTDRSIVVILREPIISDKDLNCYGICTDYGNILTELKKNVHRNFSRIS